MTIRPTPLTREPSRSPKPLSIRVLHWATALMFVIAFASSYKAFDFHVDMPIKIRDGLFFIHRLSGILAGLLLLVWFLARMKTMLRTLRTPRAYFGFGIFHLSLGLICFILPVLPWIARSQEGRFFELFLLVPHFNLASHPQTIFVLNLLAQHKRLAEVVAILLAVHVLGALFHRYVLKDDVLGAMLFDKK